MAQTVFRSSLTAKVRVRSQVSPCRIGVNAINFYSSYSIIQYCYHYADAQYSCICYKRYKMTAAVSDVKLHKKSLVVLFRERMAVCLDIHVKRMHFAGKYAEVFKVKLGGP